MQSLIPRSWELGTNPFTEYTNQQLVDAVTELRSSGGPITDTLGIVAHGSLLWALWNLMEERGMINVDTHSA